MILRTITTENFRNLAPAQHAFHERVNLVLGRNGQGKTNLLEAIYFLATTKSFRTSHVTSLLRFDASNVYVAGTIDREGLQRTQSIGLEVGEVRRRVLMLNGEKVTLTPYLAAMNVFAYSQSRLEIVRGSPEGRRRFLDRGISSIDPSYIGELTRYGRVLKQRNALLQAIRAGEAARSTLDAWDDEFVATAALVHRSRASYAREVAAAYREIAGQHDYHVANLEIIYRGSGEEAELRDHIARIGRHELRAGMSLLGPQRDELELLIDGRPAVEVLSGGETKMVVLFLKLAKVDLYRRRFDDRPPFLLDDVDAELDMEILQKLLVRLPSLTQVFATSAKESFLGALRAGPHRRLTIEKGEVIASSDFA